MATFRERVVEWMGGVTATRLEEATSRAYEAGWYDANDEPPSGDIKSYGYTDVAKGSGRHGRVDHAQMLDTVWSLWQSSPTAKRALTLKRDHIIGKNTLPVTADEDLQALLRAFWERNQLKKRARQFTLQLFLFGDQCYPAFVRQTDGAVMLGYLDPEQIETVIAHPDNSLEKWAVVVKAETAVDNWRSERGKRVLRIIRQEPEAVVDGDTAVPTQHPGKLVTAEQATLEPWEKRLLANYGLTAYSGSCFYEAVNAVVNQDRGWSDLLQVADWIDQADEVLFGLADREQMAGYFVWDVTLTGADTSQVIKRKKEIMANPPRKGSINIHNDSEAWELKSPSLGQSGTLATYDSILTLILGGLGFPRHWFGAGDGTNRATAYAQADPTEKSLEHDQGIVEEMLIGFCLFQRDQAEIAGEWQPDEEADSTITVTMPDINPTNLIEIASMYSPLAAALLSAIEGKLMTQETAVRVWGRALQEFGVELDPTAELETLLEMMSAAATAVGNEQQATGEALTAAFNGFYTMPQEGWGI